MKKHLKYIDGTSDKFWQIEVSGQEFTVTYGKNGTSGTTQTKSFPDAEECLKTAEKLLSAKVKKGYSESGEVTVDTSAKASSVPGSRETKTSNTESILKEYDEIIRLKKKDALLPFLKENAKGNLEALKKQIKKNRRFWTTFVNLVNEPQYKQQGSDWGTRGDKDHSYMISLSAIAVFNKSDLNAWDEIVNILDKQDDPYTLDLLMWAKPSWIVDYLLEQIRKSEWLSFSYQRLRFLEHHELISFNPELYSLCLGNFSEWRTDIKTRDFINYLVNDKTACERDIPQLFNYETNLQNAFFRDDKSQPYNANNTWEVAYDELLKQGKMSRAAMIENAILIQTKEWNNNLKSFFKKRLIALDPTPDELIPFQENIFTYFHSAFAPITNFGIELVKKIYEHPKFKAKSFIEWLEPVMMRNDCKAAVKTALTLLEKLNKRDPKLNKSITALIADIYVIPDLNLQEKASKLLLKIASEKDSALSEKLSGYAPLFQGNMRATLAKFLDKDTLPESSPAEQYVYQPKKAKLLVDPVTVPADWNEIVFLFGSFINSNEPLEAELLMNVYITQQHLFPSDYTQQLQPYFNQLKAYFDSTQKEYLQAFLMQKITSINSVFKGKDETYATKVNTLLLIKPLLAIVQQKMSSGSTLPLLSFPSHKPYWVEPKVLLQRIIAYQKHEEEINPVDLAIAIARMPRENTEEAIPLLKEIKGELQELLSFCLGVTEKITIADTSLFNKLLSRIATTKGNENISLWAVAARTFYPDAAFLEFETTPIKEFPFVVSPFQPKVYLKEKWSEYRNYQTQQMERTPSWYELGFDVPGYKKAPGYLLYSLDLGNERNSWHYNISSAGNANFWNSLMPQNADALACALLNSSCTTTDGAAGDLNSFLNIINRDGFRFSETSMLVLAGCFFREKKDTRSLAVEVLIGLIEKQALDTELFASKTAFLVNNKYGAFSRLAEAFTNLKDVSEMHNSALFMIMDGILSALTISDKLPVNFKRMLENYVDMNYKTQQTPSHKASAFLTHWKDNAALKPLIKQILK